MKNFDIKKNPIYRSNLIFDCL